MHQSKHEHGEFGRGAWLEDSASSAVFYSSTSRGVDAGARAVGVSKKYNEWTRDDRGVAAGNDEGSLPVHALADAICQRTR